MPCHASGTQWPENGRQVHSDSSGLEPGALAEAAESSGFGPVNLAIQAIDAMHHVTGLPWWATIPLAAVTVRTALMPLTLQQVRDLVLCIISIRSSLC